jgi:hypothetical protein
LTTAKARALRLAIPALALLAWAPAAADSACVADAQRLCAGMAIGEGRVLACLRSHRNELSGPCIRDIEAVESQAREIDLDCAPDVWTHCRGVAPGEGRVRDCLWSHWKDLSSSCRDQAARLAEKAQKVRDACGPDAERLCPGLKPGDGHLYLCLRAQESQASGPCQRALR